VKNVLIVLGTRPEAIKMAPLYLAMKDDDYFDVRLCATAQHRQMLDQVLELFQIKPDYDLNLMKVGQDLSDITSSVLLGMREVFSSWTPDLVIVHGDTTTTLGASLATYYAKIKLAHVEAGLRTGNKYAPWPEEGNRKITTAIADYNFSPTEESAENLIREGVLNGNIIVTGNTVIDALVKVVKRIENESVVANRLEKHFEFLDKTKKILLVTGHRRENFGRGFEEICRALVEISRCDNIQIVYPVHLNPSVQEPVKRMLSGINNIHLIEPQEYLPFVYLMKMSYMIITDSGGVQEEAPSLGKPVLVIRDTTERPEAVKAGTVKLVGTNADKIVYEAMKLINDQSSYEEMAKAHNPYGDGKSSLRIIEHIKKQK
jgi:UDP-N-acetylglucosamine 2-epimerase (non-hydrolysing)